MNRLFVKTWLLFIGWSVAFAIPPKSFEIEGTNETITITGDVGNGPAKGTLKIPGMANQELDCECRYDYFGEVINCRDHYFGIFVIRLDIPRKFPATYSYDPTGGWISGYLKQINDSDF